MSKAVAQLTGTTVCPKQTVSVSKLLEESNHTLVKASFAISTRWTAAWNATKHTHTLRMVKWHHIGLTFIFNLVWLLRTPETLLNCQGCDIWNSKWFFSSAFFIYVIKVTVWILTLDYDSTEAILCVIFVDTILRYDLLKND